MNDIGYLDPIQSIGFNAVAWILTNSSPGPGLGTGRSTRDHVPLTPDRRRAFCVVILTCDLASNFEGGGRSS